MDKTARIQVTVPSEFLPRLDERMQEEHIPTRSKFMLSLLIFDLMTRCPHKITGQVVTEPESLFYKVVDEIVREFPEARQKISGWLKHRIEDIVETEGRKY